LAFASDRTGIPQIYLMDSNGTLFRQITNEVDGACQPDWSPDGMQLVYISPCRTKDETEKGYQGSSLYIINADGTGKYSLPTTIGGDFDPAWSPDGKRVAFTSLRDGYNEIYMVNLDSNQTTRLTQALSMPGAISARMGAWSPFGTQIVYVLKRLGTSQIWVTTDADINITKPNDQLVQSGNAFSDFLPAWTPDGKFVVFSESTNNGQTPAWLMSMRYEDRDTKQAVRLPIEPLPIVDAAFSPDGSWMAFESWPDKSGNQDIYLTTVTGANRTRLTTDPGYDFDPVWRPFLPETTP
jgi:Tol biopolymer transport system component